MLEKDNFVFTDDALEAIDIASEDEKFEALTYVFDEEETKVPLSYTIAEEALLGMLIQDDFISSEIAKSGLRYFHFTKQKNKVLFPVIIDTRLQQGACNFDLLSNQLDKDTMPDGRTKLECIGGLSELTKIITSTPPSVDLNVANGYLKIIFEHYKLSKLKELSNWIDGQRNYDEIKIIEKISDMQGVVSDDSLGKHGLVDFGTLLVDSWSRFRDRKANPEKFKVFDSGFYFVNRFRAIAKKRVCVVGARTSVGKSIFVGNIIGNLILDDANVLLFTPELDSQESVDRLVCSSAGVPIDAWKEATISNVETVRIGKMQHRLMAKSHNLYIEDKGSQTCSFILSSVRRHMLNHKVDVVVVDYLQKLRYFGDNTKRAITDIMERFCSFAKENDIAFIVVSQLRRSEGAAPTMYDLKESGDIENFADSVILVHRPNIYDAFGRKEGYYQLVKNRQGPTTNEVELVFNDETLRFNEVDVPTEISLRRTQNEDAIPDEDRDIMNIVKEEGELDGVQKR